ncbi:MAG: phosphotransferase, partial [Bacilli bacterium]|nr:phosphotransferase [Bacilli bacterium]
MVINLLSIKKEIESLDLDTFHTKNAKNLKYLKDSRKNINIYFKIEKKEYIFRINIKGINKNSFKESKKEFKSLKLLDKYYKLGQTKAIYFSKKGKYIPHPYIIITYVRGKNIEINTKNILKIAKKIGILNKTKISVLDQKLIEKQSHNDLIKEFIKKEEYIINKKNQLSEILLQIRLELKNKKPKGITKELYFIYGDLNHKNIICNNKNIYFIDWEYLKIGTPLLDIAKLSHSKNFLKYEKIFFKEYKKYFNKIDNIYEKYLYYKDLQIFFWLISDTKTYIEMDSEDNKYLLKNYKIELLITILK